MSKRLWDKGEDINKRVHLFTVGDDPKTDLNIVKHDILASAAHARMLEKVGLLKKNELSSLLNGLKTILKEYQSGNFTIPDELEDCHTTIEDKLTTALGEPGRKIHTGRSRNDQVMVAMRLYLREQIVEILSALEINCTAILTRSAEIGHVVMPGYTHFQHAMPTSVAIWLNSFAESFLELIREGISLLENVNCNPLGAASGFGVNLPIDRSE
ncbi:MAG: argininosuccinate lyase, partial [Proteobacteria bacterium]|nr:argininosuccinate lyase [Pseudomonadota bacterium]